LSGGQQQRLAMARAWALRPQVLLLDEPTSSLDPAGKKDIEVLMADFAAEGATLIFSSHNMGQVKRLASRVIYLEQGQVRVDAPVDLFFNKAVPSAATVFLQGELS
jgi:tungstate transport system ATP-binding protein